MDDVEAALKHAKTTIEQQVDLLLQNGIPPAPPAHLQARVVGDYYADFMRSGDQIISELNMVLAPLKKSLGQYSNVLDFGVGCGRVARRFAETYRSAKLTGADIDDEAIAWLGENYGHLADFVVLPHLPPSTFADEQFDLIYSISVFTHLNEEMQFAWLKELKRIAKPGAILLLTVYGKEDLAKRGFRYDDKAPLTDGLPDFYRMTYHNEGYIRDTWSPFFEILDYAKGGIAGHQDIIVCRKA